MEGGNKEVKEVKETVGQEAVTKETLAKEQNFEEKKPQR